MWQIYTKKISQKSKNNFANKEYIIRFVLKKMPHGVRRAKNSSAYSLIVICLSGAKINHILETNNKKLK